MMHDDEMTQEGTRRWHITHKNKVGNCLKLISIIFVVLHLCTLVEAEMGMGLLDTRMREIYR